MILDIKCVLNTLAIIKTSVIKAYIKIIYKYNLYILHKSMYINIRKKTTYLDTCCILSKFSTKLHLHKNTITTKCNEYSFYLQHRATLVKGFFSTLEMVCVCVHVFFSKSKYL